MLQLVEVVKHFAGPGGERIRAIDGISLEIPAGELVALFGPSGAGKSTLLRLIAALLRPDSGQVLVDGRDVAALNERDAAQYRRRELGYVRQELDLLEGATALDNASLKLLGRRRGGGLGGRAARARLLPLMADLGLGDRVKHRAEQLSMGERQRVLIARALSTRPRLLVADEPTGSLDSRRSHDVLRMLTAMCREQGVAMLLVTHDPQAAAYADAVHTLQDGRLHDGPPAANSVPDSVESGRCG